MNRWLAADETQLSLAAPTLQAQTMAALKGNANTPGNILTYGMGYNHPRYSALTQIDPQTAGTLAPMWSYSLNNPQGQESQPIVPEG